jgi:hypothetical protein
MPTDVTESVAAPSAVVSTSEPIEIPRSGTSDYAEWRLSGKLPEKPKTADSTTADKPKEATSVTDPAPEPGKQESRRKPDAEARIRELTEENRRTKAELEELRKPKEAKADPPPARQPEATRPKPKVDDQVDGKPKYASYEDYVEELADWKAEQRIAAQEKERTAKENIAAVKRNADAVAAKYPDFWEKSKPVVEELLKPDVRPEIFAVMNDSPVLAHLLYVIGGDDATKADFMKTVRENPSKALRLIVSMERDIQAELSKETTQRNDSGQFVAKEPEAVPAKRSPETAPKPPIEIGSRGATAKPDTDADSGDFRAFKRAQDAKQLRGLKGA